jgi:hypothetical protein
VCDAVGGDQSDDSRRERLTSHQVEAATVHIGVAPTVHYELVSCVRLGGFAKISMGHQRAVPLPAEEKAVPRRDEE